MRIFNLVIRRISNQSIGTSAYFQNRKSNEYFSRCYCDCTPRSQPKASFNPDECLANVKLAETSNTFDEKSCEHVSRESLSNLHALSDRQLEVFVNTVSRNSKSLVDLQLTKLIDDEFCKRAPSWSMEELLVYFRLYNMLPKLKSSDFLIYLLKRRLRKKLFCLPKDEIVEFIRLGNECKLWRIYHVPKFDFETYLDKHLSELSLKDIAVFLSLMVNTRQVANTPKLFEKLCQRILGELPNLPSAALVLFLENIFLRKKSITAEGELIDRTLRRVLDYLAITDHFHLIAYIEAASQCVSNVSLFDEQFFEKFSQKFVSQMPDLSPNKLALSLHCLTFFDNQNKYSALYDNVVTDLRQRMNMLLKAPKASVLIMYYLSRVGIYPCDLLNVVFSQEMINRAYPKGLKCYPLREHNVLGKELLSVDFGIQIECPQYLGNRLDVEVRDKILRYYCWNIPRLLRENIGDANFDELFEHSPATSKHLFRTRGALCNLLGDSVFVHTCYLVPHLPRPNLLFAVNAEGVPQPLPTTVRERMIISRDTLSDDLEWYTFAVPYTMPSGEPKLCGEEIPKVRQLKKLGYNVVNLTAVELMGKTDDKMEQCIRNKLCSKIKFLK